MMKNKTLKRLIQSADTQTLPPEGLKEKLFDKVISMEIKAEPVLTPFERFFFEKPLRTACMFAVPISGSLWAIWGSSFVNLLNGIIR